MNCAPSDLRDYYFEALDSSEARQVKEHVAHCEQCARELEQLRLTGLALRALPDEEIPRRIAFVSDKVFTPSPVARWWQGLWLSGARMATVAMLVLAGAIVFHATRVPVEAVRVVEQRPVAAITEAGTATPDARVVKAAVDQAVAKAVAESEARWDAKLRLVAAENQRDRRQTEARVAEVLDSLDRRSRVMTVASNALLETGQ